MYNCVRHVGGIEGGQCSVTIHALGAERVETGPPSFVVMASQRSAMVALA